ncbi:hypothetical protein BJ980_002308 [Nocardioides daedukensis]|uniref:WD40 repeat domain-containing protein n=1 Tax=Nocardioides daedukensis TaxID=634462 RepID=A0A7Y9UVW9_9ACTN|nr:hypothetical protein [Nocardioides daedukensis]NYG59385.1 hypothetical protein [Nocardioides daedukensis]
MTHVVRRALAPILLALILLAGLASCGEEGGANAGGADWSESTDPVEHRGLSFADGRTIHLGDGSTIDAGQWVGAYVVAGDGIYFTLAPGDDYDEDRDRRLRLATADGIEVIDVLPDPMSLTVSPDGQHLAFIDHNGERDTFGTPQAEAVVVDLGTGEEVVRSNSDMGDPAEDDFADLYGELEPEIHGFVDDRVYVRTVKDTTAFDLDTGKATQVTTGDSVTDQDWFQELTIDGSKSPSGTWSITSRDNAVPQLIGPAGKVVATDLQIQDFEVRWHLDSWVDDSTPVGTAEVTDPVTTEVVTVLITCAVPSGTCTARTEPDGGLAPPNGDPTVRQPIG